MSDRGRAFVDRSCPHVYGDPAQACRGLDHWLLERQECRGHCSPVWGEATELYRGAFLGAWVRGINRGLRARGSEAVHSRTRGGRPGREILTATSRL